MYPKDILAKHDKYLDSLIAAFDEELQAKIAKAQDRTLKAIESQLTLASDGTIEYSAGNQRVLRSIDRVFRAQMKRAGYNDLTAAFSAQFADQLPRFQQVLNDINATLDQPLPEIKFTGADVDLFASQALGAKDMLLDAVRSTGAAAKRQALFTVGGLKFSELASELREQFGKTAAQAKAIADTSISSFYRTIASRSYAKVEQDLPDGAVVFQYLGPNDSITRPFCRMLLSRSAAKAMTRAEIDALDNGSGLGSPFISGGGWNCRHLFIISLQNEMKKAA